MIINLLSNIGLFLFVFAVLSLLRLMFMFISSLISYNKLKIEIRELIFYAICLSYIVSYILKV